jgi:hypothetical protein
MTYCCAPADIFVLFADEQPPDVVGTLDGAELEVLGGVEVVVPDI